MLQNRIAICVVAKYDAIGLISLCVRMISIIGGVGCTISVVDYRISVAVYIADVVDYKTGQVVESHPAVCAEVSGRWKERTGR